MRKTILNEYLKSFLGLGEAEPLHIELSGMTYPDPTYSILRQKSSLTVIEYVLDGEGYVVIDNKPHLVKKDTVYLLPAGEYHYYYADKKNPYKKLFLNVKGSLCQHLLLSYGLSGQYFFDGRSVRGSFDRIEQLIRSDIPLDEVQARLNGLFLEVISMLSLNLLTQRHSNDALKLKKYIDENLDRQVSADELSCQIFRSPDYCLKLFGREFGVTPYAYQLDQKMSIARSLLSGTKLSIGEIAARLGYSDVHYFSNLFCRKCGARPTAYRKRIGAE